MQFCDNFKMLYAMIYCVAMQLLREIRMTYYYYRGGSVVYRGPLRNRLSMAIRNLVHMHSDRQIQDYESYAITSFKGLNPIFFYHSTHGKLSRLPES